MLHGHALMERTRGYILASQMEKSTIRDGKRIFKLVNLAGAL